MVRSERPGPGLFSVRVDVERVSVRRDLVCVNCGYGIRVAKSLPSFCPMCQRLEWRLLAPRAVGSNPWSDHAV
jgi:hypothetical protein